MRRRGFTLIELLAVVAIVLVLLALLLPLFQQIYDRGARVVCSNNIRQLQSASLLYTADQDGLLISSMTETSHCGRTDINAWAMTPDLTAGVLWPYIRSAKSYMCPSFPRTTQGLQFKRHYSVSAFIGSTDCEGNTHGTHYVARSLSHLKNASRVICFAEEYYNRQITQGPFPGALHAYCVGVSPKNTSMTVVDPPPMWHSGGANWSFMDGHVEYKRWEGRKVMSYDIETWQSGTMSWAGDPADERDMGWIIAGTTSGWVRAYDK